MIAWAVLMGAASLAAAMAVAAAWDAQAWEKAVAPTAPLMGLGMAGGTTRTADAAEDNVEDKLLVVVDQEMLGMVEWEI